MKLINTDAIEFNVGDEVITVLGEKGKIINICTCPRCKERGFYEPTWIADGHSSVAMHYISKYDAENGFTYYYRIGNHRFHDFEVGQVVNELFAAKAKCEQLEKQRQVIAEEIGSGIVHFGSIGTKGRAEHDKPEINR